MTSSISMINFMSQRTVISSPESRWTDFAGHSAQEYADLWNPLVWLSFMFDYQLHGLNAGGYHLTNLILHILSALLLFWLFNRMTGAIWKSAFVAALFALHPLHVESVAWIAERKDVLSAFFWMLDSLPVCLLHGKTGYKKISACSVLLCLRSYEQAHGCHFACYYDSSGLLAA